MKKSLFLSVFVLLFTMSCTNEDNTTPQIDDDLTGADDQLVVSDNGIAHTTVDLQWDAVDTDEGVVAVYDIMLNGSLIKERNTDTDFTLTNLENGTTYEGEIIAREQAASTTSKKSTQVTKKQNDVLTVIKFKVTTKKFQDIDAPVPEVFNVEIDRLQQTSVILRWDSVAIADNSEISYDVYLEGDRIAKGKKNQGILIDRLDANTTYTGQVIAISTNEKTRTVNFSFTTLETDVDAATLEDFTITPTDITAKSTILEWRKPEIADGSDITYDIVLNNINIEEDYEGPVELSYLLQDLIPETEYFGQIIAKSTNGNSVSVDYSFTTLAAEANAVSPELFNVDVISVDIFEAFVEWDKANISDDSDISYFVFLDGVQQDIKFVESDDKISAIIRGLKKSTPYAGSIMATSTNGESTEVGFSIQTPEDRGNFVVFINPNEMSIVTGDTKETTAWLSPQKDIYPTSFDLTYMSSNPAIATVDGEGNVTGVSPGNAYIIATSVAYPELNDRTIVSVVDTATPVRSVRLESRSEPSIREGKTLFIRTSVTPEDATNPEVNLTSEDTNIATVSKTGGVTGISPGTTRIIGTSNENGQISDTFTVTVTQSSIRIDKSTGRVTAPAGAEIEITVQVFFNLYSPILELNIFTEPNGGGEKLLPNDLFEFGGGDDDPNTTHFQYENLGTFTMPQNGEVYIQASFGGGDLDGFVIELKNKMDNHTIAPIILDTESPGIPRQ